MDDRGFSYKPVRSSLLCSLIFFALLPAEAQYRVSSFLFKPPLDSRPDYFLSAPDTSRSDSSGAQSTNIRTKSVATAVVLSAVLPGAGQIYTGRYWKVPLILGFGAYFTTQWFRMQDHYSSARSAYQASVLRGENGGLGNAQLLYERDFYHDERDRFAFYLGITYLLNIIDAYVGASLYGFDVGDNLGGTSVKLKIPIY